MSQMNPLRFRMSIDCMVRLALIAEGLKYSEVYPPDNERLDPAFDEDFVIGTLEEAANVWKTQPKLRVPMADEEEPEVPSQPDRRR